MKADRFPGRQAAKHHGFWIANRFLLLRRSTQLAILALFLAGPLFGLWIVKGTLAASLTLGVLPLTDPLILLQSIAARHRPDTTALVGAAIVFATYLLFGGRTFCSWVCPINPLTDLAAYLRRRFAFGKGLMMRPTTRRWVLGMVIAIAAITGTIAWELINPITALWRAALFGVGLGAVSAVAILFFDLLAVEHGWCGHVCPVGAFYGLVGKATLLRVSAAGRSRCDDCLDCFAVCPERHVIAPALRGGAVDRSPVILSGDCTVCGRCVDVCPERVFLLTHRFDHRLDPRPAKTAAASTGREHDVTLEKRLSLEGLP